MTPVVHYPAYVARGGSNSVTIRGCGTVGTGGGALSNGEMGSRQKVFFRLKGLAYQHFKLRSGMEDNCKCIPTQSPARHPSSLCQIVFLSFFLSFFLSLSLSLSLGFEEMLVCQKREDLRPHVVDCLLT